MSRIIIGGSSSIRAHLVMALLVSASQEVAITKPHRIKIVKIPELEPIDCGGWNTKKTKGDKHRDRAERRRKWGI